MAQAGFYSRPDTQSFSSLFSRILFPVKFIVRQINPPFSH
ncbi:hypothetical protein yaldo0001_18770 [Yersinia aldovae ATCC 35236]|nr:hypothetical protein yaldo0001_18770 [Yersinia aldovae ATCC 35236]